MATENFLSKIKSAWKFVSDKENIKALFTKAYNVVTKLVGLLKVLKDIVTDPKFTQHIPAVVSTLTTILSVFVKLAPFLGIDLPVQAASKKLTLEEAKRELDDAVKDLDEVLK